MFKSHANAWASDAPTPAQIKEFFAQIESGKITKNCFQGFLRGDIQKWESPGLLVDWQAFYKKHRERLGLEERDFDFLNEGIRIPEPKEGFDRLIIVAKGLTPEKLFSGMKSLMPAWKYWDNLDEIVSDRKADKDYCIWIRNRVEADEELKNKSANDMKRESIPGIAIEERLLYEIKFFDETGKHLDIKNWTLCAGSRLPDGYVPCVYWRGDGVDVSWYYTGSRSDAFRARAVVS